jgi:hypothetical protein
MARAVGFTEQKVLTPIYRADGSVATGGTAQLILPRAAPRSSLWIQNTSATDTLTFEFGCARATASITNGSVTSVTVTNGGFGFTYAPIIYFLGGGNPLNGRDLGLGYPEQNSPSNVATAHAVLSGGAISSIVVDNGGSGYATAPYVQMLNDPNDNYGCAKPSATSGFKLKPGESFYQAYNVVTTDAVAVYGATTGDTWFCQYTT